MIGLLSKVVIRSGNVLKDQYGVIQMDDFLDNVRLLLSKVLGLVFKKKIKVNWVNTIGRHGKKLMNMSKHFQELWLRGSFVRLSLALSKGHQI